MINATRRRLITGLYLVDSSLLFVAATDWVVTEITDSTQRRQDWKDVRQMLFW